MTRPALQLLDTPPDGSGTVPSPSSQAIAEELRTPLTVIHGALRLLEGGHRDALGPDEQQLVAMALRNAERLAGLIRERLG